MFGKRDSEGRVVFVAGNGYDGPEVNVVSLGESWGEGVAALYDFRRRDWVRHGAVELDEGTYDIGASDWRRAL